MIHRLVLFATLTAAAAASAAPVDQRFVGKWYEPGQQEACLLGAIPIQAEKFAGCSIVAASTPEINKYNDGGITQYIAAQCAAENGSETTFYWLHLSRPDQASYGRVGAGDRLLLRRCPTRR